MSRERRLVSFTRGRFELGKRGCSELAGLLFSFAGIVSGFDFVGFSARGVADAGCA